MIHGDIKPENILLSEDGHCVITDFGGAVFDFPRGPNVYWEGKRGLGIAGLGVATPNYTAPELRWVHYTGYIYFNKAVDFWALGVMLFEFAMGKVGIRSF
jgi:serine/threonine protein kinase